MNFSTASKVLLATLLISLNTACSPGMFGNLFSGSSNGPQIYPNSTTVATNQSVSFQVSGGASPYSYQASGMGSVDSNGNFTAASSPGQAQLQVTDANSNTTSAMISVVQAGTVSTTSAPYTSSPYSTSPYNTSQLRALDARVGTATGWSATTSADLRQSPPARGQLIGVEDDKTDAQGNPIHSAFLQTNLKHPLVRVDTLIQNHQVVAARAVVEDQFWVTLTPGHSSGDLTQLAQQAGAHVSREPSSSSANTYLVSMNQPQTQGPQTLGADYFARRSRLKDQLRQLGTVVPNTLSRVPASTPTPQP